MEWDRWLDLRQPGLMVRDDVTPMNLLQAASPYCRDPVLIQCRTATPDKTSWELSGQSVRCNLWDGLVCKADDVDGPSCFNYEVRLGCLKQTKQCREYLFALLNNVCVNMDQLDITSNKYQRWMTMQLLCIFNQKKLGRYSGTSPFPLLAPIKCFFVFCSYVYFV